MTQVYMRNGKTFMPADSGSLNIYEKLPVGTYTVGTSPRGYHLEEVEPLEIKGKLYGDIDSFATRILSTYKTRPNNTGVLLAGDAGAGKTMLSKRISQRASVEHEAITILVNEAHCGEGFNQFLQSIDQPAVVIFDEFEKVYSSSQQTALLTIFDGTYATNKLFILTCNDRYKINSYMHNRPGRIFYSIDFTGLNPEFIAEYCADNLKNQANTVGVQNVAGFFSSFSFDMLKALVEEMNRYDETATQAMNLLNMKPSADIGHPYDVTILRTADGQIMTAAYQSETATGRNPMMLIDGWCVNMDPREAPEGEELDPPFAPNEITEDTYFRLDKSNLQLMNGEKGVFQFATNVPGFSMVFTRRPPKSFAIDYDAYGAF